MSYIIKNCPCYGYDYEECLNTPRDVYKNCYDISDCLLKQIADKCMRTKLLYKGSDNHFTLGKLTYADFILKDLEIEEC